jgi:FtsP/CotA-like multicopper oxidase with cupredoxin domain
MTPLSRTSLVAVCCVALEACSTPSEAETPPSTLDLIPITDINPAPGVVEVKLVATEAQAQYLSAGRAQVWAYRDGSRSEATGTIPGPLIEAFQGDRVIVHFTNALPEGTTIHWHGLRVPNASDGTPSTQVVVPPGGSFDYEFVAQDAGTFWYHPHVRGDVQVERGLYGVVVVRGGLDIPVDADRVFVLDDVKLAASGQLSTTTDSLDLMLGRQGNVLLVNGTSAGRLAVKKRARERWRFVNSANGRYFNLRLPGHTFQVIGWDGGVLPQPYSTSTLLVAPGERYEVLVEFGDSEPADLALQTIHYDRGHNVPDPGPKDLFGLSLRGETAVPAGALPSTWGGPVGLPVNDQTPTRSLVLSEEERTAEPRFFINGAAFPDVPAMMAREGDVEIWSIRNDAEMDHPFHLHGMFFRVLDVDGQPPEHLGWKDTVNIPQKKTLRFAVRYGTPGKWMFHCHILEHAERGMMGELQLAASGGP